MTSVNAFSAPNIAQLIEFAMRRFAGQLREGMSVPEDLRTSHLRLLSVIPDDGARVTDLAVEAAMTKQALGQFVDHMQQHGYVESVRSPRDKRVRIVRRTAKGTQVRDAAVAAIGRVERAWRSELGDERYELMCAALREVGLDRSEIRPGYAAEV